jgi:hypothetical protein
MERMTGVMVMPVILIGSRQVSFRRKRSIELYRRTYPHERTMASFFGTSSRPMSQGSAPHLRRRDRKARTIGPGKENNTMLDRVQITRLADSIPRWQIRDQKVSMSQLRYALRASEAQIQEAINLKPGQEMTIDLYPAGV